MLATVNYRCYKKGCIAEHLYLWPPRCEETPTESSGPKNSEWSRKLKVTL